MTSFLRKRKIKMDRKERDVQTMAEKMALTAKKLVLVGDAGCGKSCLLATFMEETFQETYIPTAFDTYKLTIQAKAISTELLLWDTAGNEQYDRLRPFSYPQTDLLLLCFSIGSPETLGTIEEKWMPEVRHFCPRVPVILVGMKKDLRLDKVITNKLSSLNHVTFERGQALATSVGAVSYKECSALQNDGVRDVFEFAASFVDDAKLAKKEKTLKCCLPW